jgi:hypothetical protein
MQLDSIDASVRQLTDPDIPSAMTLSTLAGWNQTAVDWQLLLHLHSERYLATSGHLVEIDNLVAVKIAPFNRHQTLDWLARKRGGSVPDRQETDSVCLNQNRETDRSVQEIFLCSLTTVS